MIFAYKYNGDAYIGIGNYINDEFKVIDEYRGSGIDISYLEIKPVNKDNLKTLIVGFELRKISSNLDLIVYESNKLRSILNNKDLYFGRIDIIDFNNDGYYEIVLWTHDTGFSYYVNIYEYKKDDLHKTQKYDKLYYKKVLDYYIELLKKYPDSPIYLDYYDKAKEKLNIKKADFL